MYAYIVFTGLSQVKSIKCGIWDSMYDNFQTFGQQGAFNSVSDKQVDCISIEVESGEEDSPISARKLSNHECGQLLVFHCFLLLAFL